MNSILIKLAVVLLAIKELWLLLGVPAVANTLVDFLTVGAIPGTDRTLTPSQIYGLLAVVFVVVSGLIFRKELQRLYGRIKARNVAIGQAAQPVSMPIPHPLSPITIITPADVRETVLPAGPRKTQLWAWRMKGVWLLLRIQWAQYVSVARAWAVRTGKLIAWHAAVAGRSIARISVVAAKFAARKAVDLWRAIEPYLRRFDKWLEKKLHEYDHASTLLSIGNEMTLTVRKWREEYKTLSRESSPRK